MMADELLGKVVNGYEVQKMVGQGGMARVYLARQQSMNRQVALKVLPIQFLSDDTYLQRFNREVKIVSQLEHAHIVPVYDYGEHSGQPFIVMRYMPSGSVDDLLASGALPIKRALDIITQIAPALDYAHTKGVLHRDLKPSNVLLDEAGGAFITDFGIARFEHMKGTTITTKGVVGTPSYMSPEQAQGKEMDGRSDVYSLGVMVFELMTGRRPFESETPYSIAVMQVTTPPPSPRSINPSLSTMVEKVILKSLKKLPDERYQTAVSLAEALKQAIEQKSEEETDQFVVQPQPTTFLPPHIINQQPVVQISPMQSPVVQLQHPPMQPMQSPPMMQQVPSNGNYGQAPIVYNTGSLSYSQPIKPKQGVPWLGVLFGGGLGCLVVAVLGLVVIGVFLFIASSETDSTPVPVTNRVPIVAPTTDTTTQISTTADVASTQPSINLTPTLDSTSESARATLLARQQGNDATMTAVSTMTPNSGGTSGSSGGGGISTAASIGVRERVPLSNVLSPVTGSIVYADQRGDDQRTFEIMRMNLDTFVETQLTADNADNSYPIASPDGRWVAFQSNRDGDFEIYVMNMQGGQLQQLTNNNYLDRIPSWSPDGEWVLYSADVRGDGSFDLYRTRLDGSATEVVLSNSERKSHARYSPDGRSIVFTSGADLNDARTWEIAVYDVQSGEVRRLTNNAVRDASPSFSPDGTQILYITYLGENDNTISIMNADGSNQRVLYNDGENNWTAAFSPDGQYIVFTKFNSATDELYLMTADGENAQQLTLEGGNYGSWIGQ
jgi:serine/threonine protein kinase/Tol biopolymer transport system component